MTDDQKKTSPEDEYQFPQEEFVSGDSSNVSHAETEESESAATEKKRSVLGNILALPIFKNKRVLIVIGVVIVVLIFVRLLDVEKKAPVAEPVQQTVVQQPTVVSQPNDSAMLGSLDALRAHSSRTQEEISNLRSQVSSLQSAIAQSQTDNQQLRQNLGALENQIKGLSEELQTMMTKAPTGKRIVYHLRAVVPDRAWITTGNGQTLTVTVGDPVSSYGKVSAIDSQQGLIMTTSGRKIQYGSNDY